jgi:H+/Cl- antiporter ClcA
MLNLAAKTYEITNNTCYIDGVMQASTDACTGPLKAIVGIGLAILVPFIIIGLVFFVFWVVMLVHAISNQTLKDRTLWIAVLVASFFLGFMWLATIVYYFAAKRPHDKAQQALAAQPNAPVTGAPITNEVEKQ